jgi:hypothetical protein
MATNLKMKIYCKSKFLILKIKNKKSFTEKEIVQVSKSCKL